MILKSFLKSSLTYRIVSSAFSFDCRFDNPASVAPFPIRQLTYSYLVSVNLGLLFFPDALVCDWTMNSIELIKGFTDLRNLLTILSYGVILLMAYIAISTESRRKCNVLIMVGFIY